MYVSEEYINIMLEAVWSTVINYRDTEGERWRVKHTSDTFHIYHTDRYVRDEDETLYKEVFPSELLDKNYAELKIPQKLHELMKEKLKQEKEMQRLINVDEYENK